MRSAWLVGLVVVTSLLGCSSGDGQDVTGDEPESADGAAGAIGTGGGANGGGGSSAAGGGKASGGSTGKGGSTGAGGSAKTGGSTGTGGAATGGSTSSGGSGSGGDAGPAPHVVVPCDQVEVGKWEDITPPEMVATDRWQKKNDGYGVHAIAVDPTNTANVLLGSDKMGAYRTTDCGVTWKHLPSADLDGGVGWTWAFDRYAPGTFYGVSGYGTMGVFTTTNDGDDWSQTLPPEVAKSFVNNGFTQHVRADPTTPGHLLISPHFYCENGHGGYCFMETTDGGGSWKVIDNKLPNGTNLPGDEGTRVYVESHDRWFVGQNGIYRTDDAGKNWTKAPSINSYAYEVHHRPGGKYYAPADYKVAESDDGITWKVLDKAPWTSIVTTSQTRIYAMSVTFCGNNPGHNLASAPIDDPTSWTYDTSYPSIGPANFQSMEYDVDHHILYISSCFGGMWRLRTE